jgi:hypothetical protein
MAPNRSKFQTLDVFASIDKTTFISKNTPLLSDEETNATANTHILFLKRLEEDLLANSEKREPSQDTVEQDTQSEDDYWSWCNDEPASARKQRENKRLLQQILKDEDTRIFFSVQETERRLQEASVKQVHQNYIEASTTHEDPGYWLWRSDEDVTREFFSASKLENDLISECEARAQLKDSDYIFSPSNQGDYWDWNIDETVAEKRQREKKAFLDNILLEEKMHKEFLVQTIEKCLREEAKICQEKESSMIYVAGDNNESEEGGYWEW